MKQEITKKTQQTGPRQQEKNVEMLRFLFAWAIVGFHIAINRTFDKIGFSFLKSYLICGEYAVDCFFILAFYFLVRGRSIQQSVMTFVCRKWLRLAPLIIVISIFAYIFHLCGYWGWNWAANIEQWLLIHDWAAYPRFGQFVRPGWWCSAYMLVSVSYLVIARTLPERYIPLVLGTLAIIAWRLYVCDSVHSKFGSILACGYTTKAFFYLGMGALTAHIIRCVKERPTSESSSRLVTWGYTLAEVVLSGALLVRLFAAWRIALLNHMLTALCFSALLVLFILKRGYLSRLLENNLSSFLGRYAYSIYVVHCLVLSCTATFIVPYFGAEAAAHPWVVLGCMGGVTMLLAMAGYHLVERPIMRFCSKNRNGNR